jgi:hypothetical protein
VGVLLLASPAVPTVSCAALGLLLMYCILTTVVSTLDSLLWLKFLLLLPSPLLMISLVFPTYMASLLLLAFLLLLASLLSLVSLLLQALPLFASYLLAKVSAAGNPAVAVALLYCSIEKSNILDYSYRTTTIRLLML